MRFLADESCDFAIVRALRDAGHDVVAVREMSPGLPDDKVVGLALQEVRVLLAEDKDFGQLVFASASPSPGVIFLRYPALMRQSIARAVVEYVANNKDKIAKRFTVVQPGRIRVSANADLSR